MNRRKLAELTSGIGALTLGFALGALLAPWVASVGGPIANVGLCAHAFGMCDGHRLDTHDRIDTPQWVAALYGLCWLSLAAVLLAMLWIWGRR